MRNKKTINLGNLLLSLSDAIDMANTSIAQHQQRAAYIAWEICRAADVSEPLMRDIFMAALFHDTGAISVEEKILLHNFEEVNGNRHCLRGELLLRRIPGLDRVATIVKYHHRDWQDWDEPIDAPHVMASQIILLADYVERLIARGSYILGQTKRIYEKISEMSGTMYHPAIARSFFQASKREEFWLDIASPRLYSLLFHSGPLKNVEIDFSELEIISKFFRDIIDYKSPFTAAHTSGVSSCAGKIAELLGLSKLEIQGMRIAGNLHDIGKLDIPSLILNKPGTLTKEEFSIMKSHTYLSYYVINSIAGLQQIAEWASFHHERLDGAGYPFQCHADELSIGARIVAVADIFTALAEDRPYRKGMLRDDIVDILNDMAARKHIDAHCVRSVIANYNEITDHVKATQREAREFYTSRFSVIS